MANGSGPRPTAWLQPAARLGRALAGLMLAISLAGCFASQEPLLSAEDAVFPFQRIVFTETQRDEPVTLEHRGDAYVDISRSEEVDRYWLRELRDNTYLLQIRLGQVAEPLYAYAIAVIDREGKTIALYKVTSSEADANPARGMEPCDRETICISDVDAYIALGLAAIDAADLPQHTYTIQSLE